METWMGYYTVQRSDLNGDLATVSFIHSCISGYS